MHALLLQLHSGVSAKDLNNQIVISSGSTEITFDKSSGLITGIKSNGKSVPFKGLQFAGMNRTFKEMKNYDKDDNYIVELIYDSASYVTWTIPERRVDEAGLLIQPKGFGRLCRYYFYLSGESCYRCHTYG